VVNFLYSSNRPSPSDDVLMGAEAMRRALLSPTRDENMNMIPEPFFWDEMLYGH
jgi:hypothetical protein